MLLPIHYASFFQRLPALLLAMGLALVGSAALSALADELTVLSLKDGRTVEGILVSEDDKGVILQTVGGDKTRVKKEEIIVRTAKKSPREVYAEKRKGLKNDNLEGRYALVRGLYFDGAMDLAKTEVDALSGEFPDSDEVKVLRRLIDEAIKPKDDKSSDVSAAPLLLTAADQNFLRILELNYAPKSPDTQAPDAKARLVVAKDAYEAIAASCRDQALFTPYLGKEGKAKFQKLSPFEVLDLLFKLKARNLYNKVQVNTEPKVLQKFHTDIYPGYVLKYFAGHFAAEVTGLVVPDPKAKDKPKPAVKQAMAYTSFVALVAAKAEQGEFINRAKPEESLLLQWGLPRDEAKYPAPDVKGWKPAFRSVKDDKFKEMVEWIDALWDDFTGEYPLALPSAPSDSGAKEGTESKPAVPARTSP